MCRELQISSFMRLPMNYSRFRCVLTLDDGRRYPKFTDKTFANMALITDKSSRVHRLQRKKYTWCTNEIRFIHYSLGGHEMEPYDS